MYFRNVLLFVLALLCTSTVALAQGGADVENKEVLRPKMFKSLQSVTEGVDQYEYPAFPKSMSRDQMVAALVQLGSDCDGNSYEEVAMSVDQAVGSRGSLAVTQALKNLVFTEQRIAMGQATAIIINIGQRKGGIAFLHKVYKHASRIVNRMWKARYQPPVGSPEPVLTAAQIKSAKASDVLDLQLAVLRGAKLVRSAEARDLISKIAGSGEKMLSNEAAGALSR